MSAANNDHHVVQKITLGQSRVYFVMFGNRHFSMMRKSMKNGCPGHTPRRWQLLLQTRFVSGTRLTKNQHEKKLWETSAGTPGTSWPTTALLFKREHRHCCLITGVIFI